MTPEELEEYLRPLDSLSTEGPREEIDIEEYLRPLDRLERPVVQDETDSLAHVRPRPGAVVDRSPSRYEQIQSDLAGLPKPNPNAPPPGGFQGPAPLVRQERQIQIPGARMPVARNPNPPHVLERLPFTSANQPTPEVRRASQMQKLRDTNFGEREIRRDARRRAEAMEPSLLQRILLGMFGGEEELRALSERAGRPYEEIRDRMQERRAQYGMLQEEEQAAQKAAKEAERKREEQAARERNTQGVQSTARALGYDDDVVSTLDAENEAGLGLFNAHNRQQSIAQRQDDQQEANLERDTQRATNQRARDERLADLKARARRVRTGGGGNTRQNAEAQTLEADVTSFLVDQGVDPTEARLRVQAASESRGGVSRLLEGNVAREARTESSERRYTAAEERELRAAATRYGQARMEAVDPDTTVPLETAQRALNTASDRDIMVAVSGGTLGFLTPELSRLRQVLAAVTNPILKTRSGAAVTTAEMERFKEEFGSNRFQNAQQVRDALASIRRSIEERDRRLLGLFVPDVVALHDANLRGEDFFANRRAQAAQPTRPAARAPNTVMMRNPRTGNVGPVRAARVEAARAAGLVEEGP